MQGVLQSDTMQQTVFARLGARRNLRGLTIDEISRRLALSVAQIRGLECGETRAFYNQWFYKQALRKYATYLGEPISDAELNATPDASTQGPRAPDASGRGPHSTRPSGR
jgi:transcriptional regulator with XRE-family HTH domain